jgi:hypothetical protein
MKSLPGTGEIFQQFHLVVEVNQKGLVLFRALLARDRLFRKHQIHKPACSLAFRIHRPAYAAAGIDKQADAEWQVGVARKALDRLGTAFVRKREVALLEIVDQGAMFVAHGHRQHHFVHLHFERGDGLV